MKKPKDYWEDYKRPTPAKFRRLGDSLLSVSLFISGAAMYDDKPYIAEAALVMGVIGKFLTNFFQGDDDKKS